MNEYKFNIGDEVITEDGSVGEIFFICDCSTCKNRGFGKTKIIFGYNDINEITYEDVDTIFKGYVKIGEYNVAEMRLKKLKDEICVYNSKLYELETERNDLLDVLEKLEAKGVL